MNKSGNVRGLKVRVWGRGGRVGVVGNLLGRAERNYRDADGRQSGVVTRAFASVGGPQENNTTRKKTK